MDQNRDRDEGVQPQEVERRMDEAPVERESMDATSAQGDGDDGTEPMTQPTPETDVEREGMAASDRERVPTEEVDRQRQTDSNTAGDGGEAGGYGYDRPGGAFMEPGTRGDRDG